MTDQSVDHLLVVGAGVMGSQIAALGALGGMSVTLSDISAQALEKAEREIRSRVERFAEKGRITAEQAEGALARLRYSVDLAEAARDADFVIEAVAESLPIKEQVLRALDEALRPGVVIASNSSSLVSSQLAVATKRPEHVVNMHFFNPPLLMDCVEIAGHDGVAPEAIETAKQVSERIGRQYVHIRREIPGLIANRLLAVLFREALELLEGGYATAEEIDLVCRQALNHPMGPFQLLDLGGIDVNLGMQTLLHAQTGDDLFAPKETIRRLVSENKLGRKTGEGFYVYA